MTMTSEQDRAIVFAPPAAAATLYQGDVMHARFKPKAHRFAYRVFTLLIDIDRLAEAHRQSRLFSVNRFNLLSFHEKDHGNGSSDGLASHIHDIARQAGIDLAGGRILLQAYPRLMGFVFNPISVYFGYCANGELALLIYEVRNTFGEMHSYVAPVLPGQMNEAGIRQERTKLLYVSPFIDMAQRYHFRVLPPGEKLNVRILETDETGPLLAASFTGRRRDLTGLNIVKTCLPMPFMTLKVVAGIHWEALKLWLKGVALQTRPAPPAPFSFADTPQPETPQDSPAKQSLA
jgi:uncharacterized protein